MIPSFISIKYKASLLLAKMGSGGVYLYCRYREVSPVCLGKNRPLLKEEATKEHLIPKSLLRDPRWKARLMINFNPSDAPNVDISCTKCNHLKNNLADVPFVWKLKYFQKYGISLKNKRALGRSVPILENVHPKEKESILQCIQRGDVKAINETECLLVFHHTTVRLSLGIVTEVQHAKPKLPRKLKKKNLALS